MQTGTHSASVDLPADDQVLIRRAFAAEPALVWRALTEPDLVARWWTAKRGTMVECTIDLRVGGRWRYVMSAGGHEVAFNGEYREIVEAERIVSTEAYEFEGWEALGDAAYTVNTVTLIDTGDGGTMLQTLVQCVSKEQRDAIIGSGMEAGMQDAYDLLDEVAASLG